MSYYIAPYTFDFEAAIIHADAGHVDVDCADLYDAIKDAQASVDGIAYPVIADASGLVDLGPGVAVGLTVELLGNWQFKFAPGNYIGRIAGGNLVGGPGGDPVAYTAGVQTLLIQSASSTVVTSGGSVPSAAANAAAVWATLLEGDLTAAELQRILLAVVAGHATVPDGDGAFTFSSPVDGAERVTGTVAAGAREVTSLDGA